MSDRHHAWIQLGLVRIEAELQRYRPVSQGIPSLRILLGTAHVGAFVGVESWTTNGTEVRGLRLHAVGDVESQGTLRSFGTLGSPSSRSGLPWLNIDTPPKVARP